MKLGTSPQTELQSIDPVMEGHELIGQTKWAVWRSKQGLAGVCAEDLDAQVASAAWSPRCVKAPAVGNVVSGGWQGGPVLGEST